jgi:hypothetical protein
VEGAELVHHDDRLGQLAKWSALPTIAKDLVATFPSLDRQGDNEHTHAVVGEIPEDQYDSIA